MAYYGYTPTPQDFSYIANAGNQIASMVQNLPKAIDHDELANQLKADKVKVKEIYNNIYTSAIKKLTSAGVPEEQAMGQVARIYLPPMKSEDPSDFVKRLMQADTVFDKIYSSKMQQQGVNDTMDFAQGGPALPKQSPVGTSAAEQNAPTMKGMAPIDTMPTSPSMAPTPVQPGAQELRAFAAGRGVYDDPAVKDTVSQIEQQETVKPVDPYKQEKQQADLDYTKARTERLRTEANEPQKPEDITKDELYIRDLTIGKLSDRKASLSKQLTSLTKIQKSDSNNLTNLLAQMANDDPEAHQAYMGGLSETGDPNAAAAKVMADIQTEIDKTTARIKEEEAAKKELRSRPATKFQQNTFTAQDKMAADKESQIQKVVDALNSKYGPNENNRIITEAPSDIFAEADKRLKSSGGSQGGLGMQGSADSTSAADQQIMSELRAKGIPEENLAAALQFVKSKAAGRM